MAKRLNPLPARAVVKIVKRNNFAFDRPGGHGDIYQHPDGRWTTIPRPPKKVGTGLLNVIIKQTKKDRAEFVRP